MAPPRPASRVGESAPRPDGVPKVTGAFAFSSDLQADAMLWGRTLRSPHPHARLVAVDISAALRIAGVAAVLTAEDVPGQNSYGLSLPDQPVLAHEVVRYEGEPVAVVAADHPETAQMALEAIAVAYEPLPAVTDPELAATSAPLHPDGNVVHTVPIRRGAIDGTAEVVVEGTYEVGVQDQAFLGPESGLAVPDGVGGVDLYVATQGLHQDLAQVAPCLGLSEDEVRLHAAGTGGAFGAREDLSMHVHACMLALRTSRPVKMVYQRNESFVGHVHRHPATMHYRHHATAAGDLLAVEARILLDGGAYASTSAYTVSCSARFACGPYRVPNVAVEATGVRTNNPPSGAMRGFGVVQVCFAHESQMDRLAAACGLSPLEIRRRNALRTGDELVTGQTLDIPAPVRECLEAAEAFDLPPPSVNDDYALPGGAGRTADRRRIRRGVGYAAGYKNMAYSEGYNDDARARCRLEDGAVTVTCAAAEIGQGFVTVAGQIVRSILGVTEVRLATPSTAAIGPAGSSAASRQTVMSGGAIEKACRAIADLVRQSTADRYNLSTESLTVANGRIRSDDGWIDLSVAEAADGPVEVEVRHEHRPTSPLDPETGQGNADVSWMFAAHRAVVDVDLDLGLVRVVQVTVGQDVGKALNPASVIGQIEGSTSQGIGLAVMEEVVMADGSIRNPSFTDYLIPTSADMPPMEIALIEIPEDGAPFGAKGVGETSNLPSTPAVVAAIRDATGLALTRVPVRPQDIVAARS
ncbi:MAG: xanthine dehydrogenase subunit D [Acidimicrobiia bacterium]|nr:xanthine dehydrogenase subunit D [Acidimicrobiia bacterium]